MKNCKSPYKNAMECTVNSQMIAQYEHPDFLEICDRYFSEKQAFILLCNKKLAPIARKAAILFFEFESLRPSGWKRLKMLFHLTVSGMRVAPLMAICNKALLLNWSVSVLKTDDEILHLQAQIGDT